MNTTKDIVEVVLTGGPVSGKSESLPYLRDALSAKGYRVLTCLELATMLFSNGVSDINDIAAHERSIYAATQRFLIQTQVALREEYRRYAASFPGPVIIIYDRAELDAAAYLDEDEFEDIMTQAGYSREALRDTYDAVIHLDVFDSEEALGSNSARREKDIAEARRANERVWDAWCGHPYHYRVPCSVNFEDKIQDILRAIEETIARKS